jgi:ribonuclease HI
MRNAECGLERLLSTSELAPLLRRLAETLSFARLLEERPNLEPRELRRLLNQAARKLEAQAAEEGPAAAEDLEAPEAEPEPPEESGAAPRERPSDETVATLLVDVFIDGASKGNPGPSSVGYVIAEPGGVEFVAEGRFIGRATNNEAEYRALLRALDAAERYGFRRLRIHSDSQLLVRQIQGQYRVNSPQLRALHAKAKERLAGFEHAELTHIGREQNGRADALANEAIKAELRRQKAAARRRRPEQPELPL